MDERALKDIMEMGFDKEDARVALMDHNNNLEAALNSLLTAATSPAPSPTPSQAPSRHGSSYDMHGSDSGRPPPRGMYTYVYSSTGTHTHTLAHTHTFNHCMKIIPSIHSLQNPKRR